jgi:hypothetical protein
MKKKENQLYDFKNMRTLFCNKKESEVYARLEDNYTEIRSRNEGLRIKRKHKATSRKKFKENYVLEFGETLIKLREDETKIIERLGTILIMRKKGNYILIDFREGQERINLKQNYITTYAESFID